MSNATVNNACDTNGHGKCTRIVEEAFFLLDRNHNRSINSDDLCAVAKAVGKKNTINYNLRFF